MLFLFSNAPWTGGWNPFEHGYEQTGLAVLKSLARHVWSLDPRVGLDTFLNRASFAVTLTVPLAALGLLLLPSRVRATPIRLLAALVGTGGILCILLRPIIVPRIFDTRVAEPLYFKVLYETSGFLPAAVAAVIAGSVWKHVSTPSCWCARGLALLTMLVASVPNADNDRPLLSIPASVHYVGVEGLALWGGRVVAFAFAFAVLVEANRSSRCAVTLASEKERRPLASGAQS